VPDRIQLVWMCCDYRFIRSSRADKRSETEIGTLSVIRVRFGIEDFYLPDTIGSNFSSKICLNLHDFFCRFAKNQTSDF
jgi:hypothetical protein